MDSDDYIPQNIKSKRNILDQILFVTITHNVGHFSLLNGRAILLVVVGGNVPYIVPIVCMILEASLSFNCG